MSDIMEGYIAQLGVNNVDGKEQRWMFFLPNGKQKVWLSMDDVAFGVALAAKAAGGACEVQYNEDTKHISRLVY